MTLDPRSSDVTLRDHFQALVAEQSRRFDALHAEMVLRDTALRDLLSAQTHNNDIRVREAFAASEKAISKAESSGDKRFEAASRFRDQQIEQAAQFLPREVADAQFAGLQRRAEALTESLQEVRGGAVSRDTLAARFEEVQVQFTTINQRLDLSQGVSQGGAATMGQIVAIVGVIAAIAAILIGAYT